MAAFLNARRARLPALDGLRGLAALIVVFHHLYLTLPQINQQQVRPGRALRRKGSETVPISLTVGGNAPKIGFASIGRFAMSLLSGRPALWFGDGANDYLFYPFGANGAGYFVARERRRRIMRWVCWRARFLVGLWLLSIILVVDFWAPSVSVTRKLGPEILFVAIASITAATWAVAWIADRAIFACLLSGCPAVDRWPTRMERENCFAQVGISPRNLHRAFFPSALYVLRRPHSHY